MPQFDFYSFSGQIFWTLVGFYSFYFFILHFYLANFSEMFKMRQKLISNFTKNSKISSKQAKIFDTFVLSKLS
jgi:F0F1-type ATP synthase membrane subunit b/b'